MCLAIPGKIVEMLQQEPPFRCASVEFGSVRRQVCIECVADAAEGDYVLVHAGIAISRIDPDEAARVMNALEELEALQSAEDAGTMLDVRRANE